jgi:hypothetical protein
MIDPVSVTILAIIGGALFVAPAKSAHIANVVLKSKLREPRTITIDGKTVIVEDFLNNLEEADIGFAKFKTKSGLVEAAITKSEYQLFQFATELKTKIGHGVPITATESAKLSRLVHNRQQEIARSKNRRVKSA